jgi:hypothetical protein
MATAAGTYNSIGTCCAADRGGSGGRVRKESMTANSRSDACMSSAPAFTARAHDDEDEDADA